MAEEADAAACRAEIPPMLSQQERDALVYTPQCQQRWGERRDEGAAPPPPAEDIEEFLKEFAWLKETELALQCLFEGEFDVPKAVRLLRAARREQYKARRDRDERLPSEEFTNAVTTHGKKFHLVKKALGKKVITREVVSKYYLWKRTPEFREWRLRQTVKRTKKKKKEAALMRHWGDDSDEDSETKTFLGYHNERCELCATGGKLLCCDGCARAYHFSCVQPPITKIPRQDEDWFCAHCQKAFGGPKPKLMPSEFGLASAPFPGVARSLSEAITDASSYEDEDDQSDYSDDDEDDDEVQKS
ncbi:putative helicase [Phytophthora cinnamomi]|uniref:putative helicase n=1 Tax=Phytophthora cinnamomi TaxID=4785 RepID=UPI00355ABDEA|nr:putative helicase [Phytophthora cinnamomi]